MLHERMHFLQRVITTHRPIGEYGGSLHIDLRVSKALLHQACPPGGASGRRELRRRAGAFGYLLKEAAGHELVVVVRTLQRGNRYFSEKIAEITKSYL